MNLKHGHGNGSRTYQSWASMIQRCTNRAELSVVWRARRNCLRTLVDLFKFLSGHGRAAVP